MFQALSTTKYHCGHQESPNCSSSVHFRPPNLSCPWPPPPKSEGIIFVRQSINHLKWAAQHSLQSPTTLEARTFPLLEATMDPVVYKVDLHTGQETTASTPCLTQSLDSPETLIHLVSQTGASTSHGSFHGLRVFGHIPSFILMTCVVTSSIIIIYKSWLTQDRAELKPRSFAVGPGLSPWHQDWVLLLPWTAYHFLFCSYIAWEKWVRRVTFLPRAKTSRFALEMIWQQKERVPRGWERCVNLTVLSSQLQDPNYTPADLWDLISAVS